MQNPDAGVCVECISEGNSSQAGSLTEWNANMFRGNWLEALCTASTKQKPINAMTAEDMGVVDWMTLERNRSKINQSESNGSIGASIAEREVYQPKVSIKDRPDLDLAALRGAKIAGSRQSHNSVLCRQRIEAAMTVWLSLIRDVTKS